MSSFLIHCAIGAVITLAVVGIFHVRSRDNNTDFAPRSRGFTGGIHITNRRGLMAVIPILLVNTVAFFGQLAFLREHLHWLLPGDVLFACALESIAVYLAYHAHIALVSNDSAFRLRLASYGFGGIIGCMNYTHYAGPRLSPTFAAVALGLMSASSPWLWAIHSRRQSRDILAEQKLIEPSAIRLGTTRIFWHPLRSVGVIRSAAWTGERSPAAAIAAWTTSRQPDHKADRKADRQAAAPEARQAPPPEAPPVTAPDKRHAIAAPAPQTSPETAAPDAQSAAERVTAASQAGAVRVALSRLPDATAPQVCNWLAERGWPGVAPSYVRQVRSRDITPQRDNVRQLEAVSQPPDTEVS